MATEKVIWLDGDYLPWDKAAVHVLTHTLHYSFGAFEGVRAYATPKGSALFRCQEHIDRLFRSVHILNMQIPYAREELIDVCQTLVRRNNLPAAYLRPLVFYGGGYLGMDLSRLQLQVMVAAWEWNSVLGEEQAKRGLNVKISSYRRSSVGSTVLKAKATGNYLNSILALQEAKGCGCDEALFLDQEGFICEGSGANVFIVRDGILYTPTLDYALEGITRDTIFELAKDLNITIKEKRISRDEIYIADEAFFTGTAVEILPIVQVDGRKIGSGEPGLLTQHLSELFYKVVKAELPNHLKWLTFS